MARREGNIAPGTYTHLDGSAVVVPSGRAIYILNSDRSSTRRGLHVRNTAGKLVRVRDLQV